MQTYSRLIGGIMMVAVMASATMAADNQETGGEPAPAALLEDVESRMAEIRTVSTRFVQKKKLSLFAEELEIHGTLFIEKPDRFAWKVHSPIHYILILNKDRLIQWDETAGQVSETSLSGNPLFEEVVAQVTGWFFGAYRDRKGEYDVSVLQKDPLVLEFQPRKETPVAAFMKRLTLTFLPDRRYISEIFFEEAAGDTTRLMFEDTHLNQPLESSVWEAADGVR